MTHYKNISEAPREVISKIRLLEAALALTLHLHSHLHYIYTRTYTTPISTLKLTVHRELMIFKIRILRINQFCINLYIVHKKRSLPAYLLGTDSIPVFDI